MFICVLLERAEIFVGKVLSFQWFVPKIRPILRSSLFLCPHIEMNFWKPGEAYPDGMEEEKVELDKEAPVDRMAREITKSKVQLSDRMKNMSVGGWESD